MDRGKRYAGSLLRSWPRLRASTSSLFLNSKIITGPSRQPPHSLRCLCSVLAYLAAVVERDGLGERVQLLGFSPGWDAGDCGRAFLSTAQRYQPTALVFDTFPRGLGLEIPADFFRSSSAYKTLINASLPRSYVSSTELHPFVDSFYDSVITPGEEDGTESTRHLPTFRDHRTLLPHLSSCAAEVNCQADSKQRPLFNVMQPIQPSCLWRLANGRNVAR